MEPRNDKDKLSANYRGRARSQLLFSPITSPFVFIVNKFLDKAQQWLLVS